MEVESTSAAATVVFCEREPRAAARSSLHLCTICMPASHSIRAQPPHLKRPTGKMMSPEARCHASQKDLAYGQNTKAPGPDATHPKKTYVWAKY